MDRLISTVVRIEVDDSELASILARKFNVGPLPSIGSLSDRHVGATVEHVPGGIAVEFVTEQTSIPSKVVL